MKNKVECDENKQFIDYVLISKTLIIYKNWVKNKKRILDEPCHDKSCSVYPIAKLVNQEEPLVLLMPEVYFDKEYCSTHYESWDTLFQKKDLFIALENRREQQYCAFSLETLYLTNKHHGFLRTTLRYDDKQRTEMSNEDQKRFLLQLKKRYPDYYQEYSEMQPSKDDMVLTHISEEKFNYILDAVVVMLVLSCHKNGLRETPLPGSLIDSLSAYGYQLLIQILSENLTSQERSELNSVWVKNIRSGAEKTVQNLIDSALEGGCTTTLGLYWLGLIKEFRPQLSLTIHADFVDKIYSDLVEHDPDHWKNASKNLFKQFIEENVRYIVMEMLGPPEEQAYGKMTMEA